MNLFAVPTEQGARRGAGRRPAWRSSTLLACGTLAIAVVGTACSTPSPRPTASGGPTPSPTTGQSVSLAPTVDTSPSPLPPLSLALPTVHDNRVVRFAVSVQVPANGGGRITVKVTNLSRTRIGQIVLRWPTGLDTVLFLAPFTTHSLSGALVQPWTKWVIGPGEQGEPAGTTSLGYGPIDPGTTLTIPIYVTRRAKIPVAFDLQLLVAEAILTTEAGGSAWTRVSVP
jgi:hypothetical protein